MSSPDIYEFHIDDANEDEMAAHGISVRHALQVLENAHLIVRNKKWHRATHKLIGRDDGGRCFAIPVEPTYDPEVWRPVTAWPCGKGDDGALENAGM